MRFKIKNLSSDFKDFKESKIRSRAKGKAFLFSMEAKVEPPLSTSLGQFGASCQDFCNEFNEQTDYLDENIPLRIAFHVMIDRKSKFFLSGVEILSILCSILLIDFDFNGEGESNFIETGDASRFLISVLVIFYLMEIFSYFYDQSKKGSLHSSINIIKSNRLKVSNLL